MLCPECNTYNEDSSSYCAHCGSPLSAAVDTRQRNKSGEASLIIMGLAAGALVLAGIVFFLLPRQESPVEPSPAQETPAASTMGSVAQVKPRASSSPDESGTVLGNSDSTETEKAADTEPTQPDSAVGTAQQSEASSFPRMWSGTYIGTSSLVEGGHHISRAVAFYFMSVTDTGALEGICYVGTDETGQGETYGTCWITGNINWNTNAINMQGTSWIDQGGLGDLREYGGTVDLSSGNMGGTTCDVGTGLYETPWTVHAVESIGIWQNGSLTTVP